MAIRIYNTLTGKKETFTPIEKGNVKMYVCGPTVYDSAHIGHARSVVVFDVVARYFEACGFDVTYVRNFTDVDDKIINRANQLGVDCSEVSEKYIAEFHKDMDELNVRRPDIEPKVTEHIGPIIEFIQKLIQKGHAYPVDGDVYFAIDTFAPYGKLSGRKVEEMEAGARVEIDTRKKNAMDFVLWKSAKPGESEWESPWGKGRPGWHIECSAMSYKYLGESFDIHGGGKDLVFPHHENEVAQSCAVFDDGFAKFWMHNGFVTTDKEKMSKSLGNFRTVRDIIDVYPPEAVRLFLLSSQYRSPIDFSEQSIEEAVGGLEKIYALLQRVETTLGKEIEKTGSSGALWNRFADAMDDDFNTAKSIGVIFDAIRSINRLLDEKNDQVSHTEKKDMEAACSDLLKMINVLGIATQSPEAYFTAKQQSGLKDQAIDPAFIEEMILKRKEARAQKDFAQADRIRDELAEKNITLEDRPDGTIWKIM